MAQRTIELVLKSRVDGLISGVKTAQRAATDAGKQLDEFRQQNEQAWNTAGRTMTVAGTAMAGTAVLAGKAAMDWETAWAGVQKTNDGTSEQMTRLEEDLRHLAKTLPATHQEIAATAEAAGQLGVGVDDVAEFTETMVHLGETTDLSADQAATALARFSNVTGTSFDDVDRLGSALVGLGNNFAATESEILHMAEGMASAGTQAGFSEGEILGLATAMTSVGINAEAGGTAITMTFNEIDGAVREGGESLDAWAELAGTSASKFADAWRNDPAEAMEMVIAGLGEVAASGGDVNGTLEELGITGERQARVMRDLASSGDLAGRSMAAGNEEFEKNIALTDEAALRYETTKSKIESAWGGIQDAAITAGETILPMVGDMADAAGDLAGWFSDLDPVVAGVVTKLTGFGGLAIASAGGLMLLAPRALDTYQAFKKLNASAKGLPGNITKVGKAAGGAAIGFAALMIVDELTDQFNMAATTAAEFDTEIRLLADGASKGGAGLDDLFASRDYSTLGLLPTGVRDLNSALSAMDTVPYLEFFEEALTLWGLTGDTAQDLAKNDLATLDEAISGLAESGELDLAAVGFRNFAEAAEEAGWSTERILNSTPDYTEKLKALGAQHGIAMTEAELYEAAMGNLPPVLQEAKDSADKAAKQDELTGALEDVGLAADGAVESLTDYLDLLFKTGLAEQSAMQAQASYQESLRGVKDAVDQITDPESGLGGMSRVLNEAKDGFDLTTEAGALAQGAFLDVAGSGLDMATAMADAGASQEEIQEKLEGTYQDLIDTAGEFDITGTAAEDLARAVMGIDDDVSIESWMSEEAKNTADDTAASTLALPDGVDIDTFMSDSAYRMSELTRGGIDNIPNSDEVKSYMEDDAFIEALQTRAAVLGIPDEDAVSSFMSSAARDEADRTTAEILGIPEGTSISSFMSSSARGEADALRQALNNVDGRVTRSSHVHTITTREVKLSSGIVQNQSSGGLTFAKGGRLPGYADGGRLPYTGLGTDQILGISSSGRPAVRLDDGEWMIRESSARKYDSVLDRINRDHPSVQHLAGYANGGRPNSPATQAQQLVMASAGANTAPATGPAEMVGTLYLENGAMAGQVRMSARDSGVIRAFSQGLASQDRRDQKRG